MSESQIKLEALVQHNNKRHGQAVAERSSVSQHPLLCFTQLPLHLRQRGSTDGVTPFDANARVETA